LQPDCWEAWRTVSSLVFGVGMRATFTAVALALAALALAACTILALRASIPWQRCATSNSTAVSYTLGHPGWTVAAVK
jgi:hypothetical protein